MRRPTAAVSNAMFFLLAPSIMAGLIPWLLTGSWQVGEPLPYWMPMRVLGGVLLVAGIIVLVGAFARFVVESFETPAPVAAPERLVVSRVYRYVRNPMYVAVLGAIVGQALLLGRLFAELIRTERAWALKGARTARQLVAAGYITPSGNITNKGRAVILDEGREGSSCDANSEIDGASDEPIPGPFAVPNNVPGYGAA